MEKRIRARRAEGKAWEVENSSAEESGAGESV
jgi:hypothetical protein